MNDSPIQNKINWQYSESSNKNVSFVTVIENIVVLVEVDTGLD